MTDEEKEEKKDANAAPADAIDASAEEARKAGFSVKKHLFGPNTSAVTRQLRRAGKIHIGRSRAAEPSAAAAPATTMTMANTKPSPPKFLWNSPFKLAETQLVSYEAWARNRGLNDIAEIIRDLRLNGDGLRESEKFTTKICYLSSCTHNGAEGPLKALLNAGGDPNAMDGSPLTWAAIYKFAGRIRILLAAGANASVLFRGDELKACCDGLSSKLRRDIRKARQRKIPKLRPSTGYPARLRAERSLRIGFHSFMSSGYP